MAMSGMIKQNNVRKAEKALKEILDKADSDGNGKVELKDFIEILESNGVEVRSCCVYTEFEKLLSDGRSRSCRFQFTFR